MANKAFMEMDETYQDVQEDIRRNANAVEFDEDVVEPEVVDAEEPELPNFMKGGE